MVVIRVGGGGSGPPRGRSSGGGDSRGGVGLGRRGAGARVVVIRVGGVGLGRRGAGARVVVIRVGGVRTGRLHRKGRGEWGRWPAGVRPKWWSAAGLRIRRTA